MRAYALLYQRQCLAVYNMTNFYIMGSEKGRRKEHHVSSISPFFSRSMHPQPYRLTLINIELY